MSTTIRSAIRPTRPARSRATPRATSARGRAIRHDTSDRGVGELHDALVIGAGPAGLATSRELARCGVEHVVLERGDSPGTSWANLYDSLSLTTGKHLSALPGLRHSSSAPLYLPRADFLAYLKRYATHFALPIVGRCDVRRAVRSGGQWHLETSRGPVRTRQLVLATGVMSNPRLATLPGQQTFRGRITHSIRYRTAGEFAGRRVVVVGVGNSAGDIASELAAAGVDVTLCVRSGATVMPRSLFGIPVQYLAYAGSILPRAMQYSIARAISEWAANRGGPPVFPPGVNALDAIPVIGLKLIDAIRAGEIRVRPGIATLAATSVRFVDGAEQPVDDVILATGFAAAIQPFEGLVTLDAHGNVSRRDRVVSVDASDLFVVGQRYEVPGAIHNISRDAPRAAALVAHALDRSTLIGG